jgi:hypothetical protein
MPPSEQEGLYVDPELARIECLRRTRELADRVDKLGWHDLADFSRRMADRCEAQHRSVVA